MRLLEGEMMAAETLFASFRPERQPYMSGNATNRKARKSTAGDMRPEYDFSGAVRGKYYKRYQEGTNVVVLEPDVARRFKTAAAVNDALRSLMQVKSAPRASGSARATRTRRQVSGR
jgi:hypothetical protein